ncbi:hypothetical protein B0T10DRAFT_496539 [Thelonectria olida]|uniref:Uncharacterized protein n=1 Tax=Thelonectria olida TaxID=1576542 RepID=A0A9P8VU23_9HYPO|nr:hypothetical protein B0T10DRAFT_496539 [Thelonectria olida]
MDTTSSSSSAPSWQIDIPSLTGLITRAGARGLQQLAHAGVDMHTIGCIMTLGEITPACDNFRRAMHQKRAGQRRHSWFIHDLVEFGAGVNFVVDEFLKTRAGENVLAMLTSISILPETATIEILTKLFEEVHAPAHGTPSYGQLQAVRSVALPLARALDFKDQVVIFHVWLCNQFANRTGRTEASGTHPFFNMHGSTGPIPDNSTILAILTSLKSILIQPAPPNRRLIFYGLSGAAWLSVYASKVLGVSVCIRAPNWEIIPISGSYASAKVLIIPGDTTTIEVEQETDPSVVIVRGPRGSGAQYEWLIDCGDPRVDIVALICGWPVVDRAEMGSLIFSMALDYVALLDAGHVDYDLTALHSNGFRKYHSGHKHLMDSRLRDILRLMGLPSHLFEVVDWSHYFTVLTNSIPWNCLQLNDVLFHRMGKMEGTYDSCGHAVLTPPELNVAPNFCPRCGIEWCVRRLSFAAAVLSFTDWATQFRKLSMDALLANTAMDFEGNLVHRRRSFILDFYGGYYGVSAKDFGKQLTFAVSLLCCPNQSQEFLTGQLNRIIGINLDGVLLVENAGVIASLQPGSPRFRLCEGEFVLNGDKRRLLVSSASGGHVSRDIGKPGLAIDPWKEDYQYSATLSVNAKLSAEEIDLRYEYVTSPTSHSNSMNIIFDVDIHELIQNLHCMFTTAKCHHNPRTPRPMVESLFLLCDHETGDVKACKSGSVISGEDDNYDIDMCFWRDNRGDTWTVVDPVFSQHLDDIIGDDDRSFYVFPVAGNPVSQWAAACFSGKSTDNVLILQDMMCLDCMAEALSDGSRTNIEVITQV